MALRLMVEGCRDKVRQFVDFLKISQQWRFYNRSRLSIGTNEMRIDYFFDENPHMKPSITTRNISKITLKTEDGQEMEMTLLDAEIVEMGNGITYIHGKSYDIYS